METVPNRVHNSLIRIVDAFECLNDLVAEGFGCELGWSIARLSVRLKGTMLELAIQTIEVQCHVIER
jgi:hypothetical protein